MPFGLFVLLLLLINLGGQRSLQLRVDAFNVTNTPHFSNPGANRSSLQLNPDGTVWPE